MTKKPPEPTAIDFDLPLPEGFDTPEFVEEWLAFCEHRVTLAKSRKRTPWTENAAKATLRKLARYDVETAITALQDSVSGSWQGVFPEKVVQATSRAPMRRQNEIDTSRFPRGDE